MKNKLGFKEDQVIVLNSSQILRTCKILERNGYDRSKVNIDRNGLVGIYPLKVSGDSISPIETCHVDLIITFVDLEAMDKKVNEMENNKPSFKRGDKVLVSNNSEYWLERILAADYDGIVAICVCESYESNFLVNGKYTVATWSHIKPIPEKIEVSKEAYGLIENENKEKLFKVV
jgi:hypothetical protein